MAGVWALMESVANPGQQSQGIPWHPLRVGRPSERLLRGAGLSPPADLRDGSRHGASVQVTRPRHPSGLTGARGTEEP